MPELGREQQDEGMALARGLLDQYRVLESADWQQTPLVAALVPEQKQQLREEMGELLVLLAGASARRAQLDLALRFSSLAEACYPADAVPPALWRQRAELARSVGRDEEARRSSNGPGRPEPSHPATVTCSCSPNTGKRDASPKPCPSCTKPASDRATISRCG